MQAHITQAKETLSTLKENMTDKIRKTLAAVKQHGISALNKAADFLGVKKSTCGNERQRTGRYRFHPKQH